MQFVFANIRRRKCISLRTEKDDQISGFNGLGFSIMKLVSSSVNRCSLIKNVFRKINIMLRIYLERLMDVINKKKTR
jgi:hypothetical protein